MGDEISVGDPWSEKRPRQVFVVGRNRSGTKWLTNQISNHPDVAAITAPGTGVLEANLFEHFPRMFGDLRIDDHYYAFLAAFQKSSAFYHSGLPESVLYERRHTDYLEFFAYLMDRLAAHRGTGWWLQKGSSLMLPRLKKAFPDAKFLIMRRMNVLDNVRSQITLSGANSSKRSKPLLVGRTLASYYAHAGVERMYLGDPYTHFVTYEAMRTDKEKTLRAVCDFLGLEFDPVMLHDSFPPNTSFKRAGRDEVFTRADLLAFNVLNPVMRALPGPLIWRIQNRTSKRGPRKGERLLIAGAFRSYRHEIEGQPEPEAAAATAPPVMVGGVGQSRAAADN